MVEVENQINLGQPGSYGTKYLSQVEIDDSNAEDNLPFADNLLTSLVDHKLIDKTFAINLLFTFGTALITASNTTSAYNNISPH